ncbi:MAG: hypothetical protein NLN64_06125 [Candidatus Thalassarchaeaceae archaeon]|nr:hypothetical protein [Candidatus Thalassarchaeaceae archaeon]
MNEENWWEENESTEDTNTSLQDSKTTDESAPVENSVDSIPLDFFGTEYQIPRKWFRRLMWVILPCYFIISVVLEN